jgi:heme A synthase
MKERLSEVFSRSTTSAANGTPIADMRVKLSILWVFAVLNYIYADVFTALDPSSDNGSVRMSHGIMLGVAVFMETAMVMVPLARLLKYRANRWANVVAGILHTVAVIGSLFVTGKIPASYYIFFACVESVTTSIIVWNAWKWTEVQID